MATYEIKEIYPCGEEGYVYADVLVNDDTEPRRLIIPEATGNAQVVMSRYMAAEENAVIPIEPVVDAEVIELIDTPVEV